MAWRTTAALVRGIVKVDVVEWADISPFITMANLHFDAICQASAYPDAQAEMIERLLAAHYYCVADPRLTMEQVDVEQRTFQSKVDLGLSLTPYGQQAMRLDTDGNLARQEADIKKGFRRTVDTYWLGRRPEGWCPR